MGYGIGQLTIACDLSCEELKIETIRMNLFVRLHI